MDRKDQVLIYGLVFAAVMILIITVLVRVGTDEAAASWVQAIGTVAAIVVALWLARSERREHSTAANMARDVRARSLAYRLVPLVSDIMIRADGVKSSAMVHDYGRALLQFIGRSNPTSAIKVMTIGVAWRDNIYDRIDDLPPPIAKVIAHLLYDVATFDRDIEAVLVHAGEQGSTVFDDSDAEDFEARIAAIWYQANEALVLLEPLHSSR